MGRGCGAREFLHFKGKPSRPLRRPKRSSRPAAPSTRTPGGCVTGPAPAGPEALASLPWRGGSLRTNKRKSFTCKKEI